MTQIDMGNRLTDTQIMDLIKGHDRRRFLDNLEYYKGQNPVILRREFKDVQAPHNKIPMSYGRKIIKTVGGYMFKPGLVNYTIEDEGYKQRIKDIFYENREPLKTYQLGVQSSLQGVGFEIHYLRGTEPRFAKVDAASMIPIYSLDIEPELIACIRHVERTRTMSIVDVYYQSTVAHFTLEKTSEWSEDWRLVPRGEEAHLYDMVPVVVFRNNEEEVGDFEPVRHIIDAYDVLMSDSMNEFDRFAWAYLVLKGMSMTKDEAERIKQLRVIQNLSEDGDVKFLTKDIPSEFIDFMSGKFRKEIHKQSHIPDFTDDQVVAGDLSGKALKYMLYDFEFIGATKEANFKEGLLRRFDLINSVLAKRDGQTVESRDIEIVMNRNERADMLEMAQTMTAYAGHVSERTLLENFAPFVQDVDAELEEVAQEKEANMAIAGLFDADTGTDTDTESEIPDEE